MFEIERIYYLKVVNVVNIDWKKLNGNKLGSGTVSQKGVGNTETTLITATVIVAPNMTEITNVTA